MLSIQSAKYTSLGMLLKALGSIFSKTKCYNWISHKLPEVDCQDDFLSTKGYRPKKFKWGLLQVSARDIT